MKRNIPILTLLMSLSVLSCVKTGEDKAEDVISISVAESTKVHIEGLKTCWDKGDAVTVFYKTDAAERWTFMGETGDVSGQISCEAVTRDLTRSDIFVLYPYDGDAVLEGDVIHTEIPSVQQYRMNSYGTALLASRSDFDIMHLSYCTAVMELEYRGPAEISQIVLRGNDGEKISGESSISFEGKDPMLTCNGSQSVTLDCDVTVGDSEKATFCFSIAPGTFSKGVTFTVCLKNGTEQTVFSSENFSVEAGHIHTVEAGSTELPYTRKILHLLFSDGKVKNNPFTEDIRFKCGAEIGPYYYKDGDDLYPFHMLCQTALASGTTSQHNFRITNGGGLYIGGTEGDYMTFPGVKGYRLQDIAVSLNKDSDFHIVPADGTPDQTVGGGVCTGSQSGDFRMLSLSDTEVGKSYRMYVDNICCFRSITLYYRK